MKGKVGTKMKKIIAILLVLTCAFVLFACSGTPQAPTCTSCVDANPQDAKCDVCGKDVPCEECVDEDPWDGECDVCGDEVPCEECIDEDPLDAKCDICGDDVPCEECIDEDPADTKCDICGKNVKCVNHVDKAPKDAVCDVCYAEVPCKSCVDKNNDLKCDVCDGDVEEGSSSLSPEEKKLAEFVKHITSSEPTVIKTVTTYNDLLNDNTLTGKYETTIYGENFKMYASYDKYAIPGPGADPDSYIKNEEITVYYYESLYGYKAGVCGYDEIDNWGTSAPAVSALGAKLDLNLAALGGEYSISYDGKVLTADLFDESIKAVLGIDIDVLDDSSVTLEIKTDGKYLRNINISYQVDNGTSKPDTVSIQTSYTYGAVESPFEASPAPSEE